MNDHINSTLLIEAMIDGAMNSIWCDDSSSVDGAFAAITCDWNWTDKETARSSHYTAHESADNNATQVA